MRERGGFHCTVHKYIIIIIIKYLRRRDLQPEKAAAAADLNERFEKSDRVRPFDFYRAITLTVLYSRDFPPLHIASRYDIRRSRVDYYRDRDLYNIIFRDMIRRDDVCFQVRGEKKTGRIR